MRHLYLLGYPVAHSLSPAIQNAALRALGLNFKYSLMPATPEELNRRVLDLKDLSVAGFNVTIPHKVAVLPLLDGLDEVASDVGAVNTVVNCDGRLIGYNTDCPASLQALVEAKVGLTGSKVVVLGAGGAAKAVVCGLAQQVNSIMILARDDANAKQLAKMFEGRGAEIAGANISQASDMISETDILINTTPVGMRPNVDSTPIEGIALHSGLTVFDFVYNPVRTRLLRDAEAVGARSVSGLSMLVYQGAEAFRLWTGRIAPTGLMMGVAKRIAEGDLV